MDKSPAPRTLDLGMAWSLDQSASLMLEVTLLQHGVRNILTPALLSADMLLTHADPVIARQAEIVINAITRVIDRVG